MVSVSITNPDTKETFDYFMEQVLKDFIDKKIKEPLTKKDEDHFMVISGFEGAGKSTFGLQIGRYADPTLTLDRVVFDPIKFREAILNAKKGQCVIFDEAYRGLGSRGALTEVNKILVSLIMEMRQKNLFIIIILPSFFLLEKYIAIWRSKSLLHVYRNKKGQRGYFVYYNKKARKTLFIKGKRDYDYNVVKPNKFLKGRFYGKIPMNDKAYRDKKKKAFQEGFKHSTKSEKFKEQRDHLLTLFFKEVGFSRVEFAEYLNVNGFKLKSTQISDIIKKNKDKQEESI